jgi:DNA-binding Xre family transcriptional regulator|tara:strand:+ start:87 stop:305 length:219 start_codon:yes stop_codon:yes gene_type:complete
MRMNANEKRRQVIRIAMSASDINKLKLAKALGLSYPTMLSKLKSPGSLKLSEVDNLCNILGIELTEFLNPLN